MNSFTSSQENRSLQLVESMFQNMFPSINPTKVNVNSIRRCVLLNYDKETKTIDFRHYTIKVVPMGLNRGVKKIVTSRVPNLGRCQDMADFLAKGGAGLSESEGEEDEASRVTLPQGIAARGAVQGQQSSVRLVELGPRMKLSLIKIEEGLLDGEVLHHEFVEKTDEEKKLIKEKRLKRKKEKEQRRRDQEQNIKKKQKERELNKSKSLEGMKKKEEKEKSWQGEKIAEFKKEQGKLEENVQLGDTEKYVSSDDDEKWFEQEVGEKPDKDLFNGKSNSNKAFSGGKSFTKRHKKDDKRGRGFKEGNKGERRDGRDSKKEKRDWKGKKAKRPTKVFNSDGVG